MRIYIVDPGFEYSTLAIAESYTRAFEKLGYEVIEYDTLSTLQTIRKGLSGQKNLTIDQVTEFVCSPILTSAIVYKIDVVLMVHGYFMNPAVLASLRSLGIKTGVILTDEPQQVDVSTKWSKYYDYVFCNDRNTVKFHGKNAYYLPVAVDQTKFKPQNVEGCYKSDILIAGSFYKERIEFIENNEKLKNFLLSHNTCFVGAHKLSFKDVRLNFLFRDNKISYEEMAKYTAGAKVVIDIPRDEFYCGVFKESNKSRIRASCLSPRVFECLASKSTCLTGMWRSDIRKLFPNKYIPTWDDAEDLTDKLKGLLENNISDEMKEDQYRFIIENHTYEVRAKEIARIMNLSPQVKDLRADGIVNVPINNAWDKKWKSNFEEGKKSYYKHANSVESLKEFKESDEIDIVSNGPSREDVKWCVHSTDKHTTFLLNKALNLSGYSVPNMKVFAVAIHPDEDLHDRCYKNMSDEFEFIPLICSTLVCPSVVHKWINNGGQVYMFNTGKEHGIKKEVYDYTKFPVVGAGYTVAYSAISLAIYLGYKKINLYGLDFCYLHEQKYVGEELKINDVLNKGLTLVSNVCGEPVVSESVMIKSKNVILDLIKGCPDIQFNVYGRGTLFNKSLANIRNVV